MIARFLTSINELDTNRGMPAEASGGHSEHLQQQPPDSEQSRGAAAELTAYIDNTLIASLRERLAQKHAGGEIRATQRINIANEGILEVDHLPR
jgi:hypothetical protein